MSLSVNDILISTDYRSLCAWFDLRNSSSLIAAAWAAFRFPLFAICRSFKITLT